MKNVKILGILCTAFFAILPTNTALQAPLDSHMTKQLTVITAQMPEKTVAKKTEEKIIPPAVEQMDWISVGANSKLAAFYDTNSLKYDTKNGIITAWTKWVYKGGGPDGVKYVLLLSQYDVRVKTYSDLYFLNYTGENKLLKEGPAPDKSWAPIFVNTLGEDMRIALNNYLISH